jgi:hypothetical protein
MLHFSLSFVLSVSCVWRRFSSWHGSQCHYRVNSVVYWQVNLSQMCRIYFIVRVYHLLARELSFSSRLRWAPLELRSSFGVTTLDVWGKLRWCKRKLLISKSNWMRFKIWLILIGQFLLHCPWTSHILHDCSPTPPVPNSLLTCRASSNVVVTFLMVVEWN